MSEESPAQPPPPKPRPDVAAETGRLAGRLVSGLGVRLLRTRTMREIVRRAHEEATRDEPEDQEPAR